MPITIYDSLRREKIPFQPLIPGQVRMYVCGPTVYSDCHVGHTMGPVLFDAVARWLAARGYEVRFVNNITDIEDKIIKRAQETGEPWQAITERYTAQYNELLQDLAVTTITDQPKCTEFIPQMISFIERLLADGRAYQATDGVYYDVQRQADYGKLSGRSLADMQTEDDPRGLHHPADFALWKLAKADEPSWASPWGDGRPGWHIECSVMAGELLGDRFDIHGGGEELKFPHHENEIAQSEACGHGFAGCWMHNGLVQYDGKKISKSDPRMRDPAFSQQFQASWLVATYGGEALRLHILRGHYRRPQDFKQSQLEGTRTTLERLRKQLRDGLGAAATPVTDLGALEAIDLPDTAVALRQRFTEAMDDDFNTGAAIAQLFPLAAEARKADDEATRQAILQVTHGLAGILVLLADGLAEPASDAATAGAGDDQTLDAVLQILIRLRHEARANRDFATADRLRDECAAAGIQLTDGPDGTSWSRSD